MSSLIQVALAETRRDDVARSARLPRYERSLPPPSKPRVRGAAATVLVRTALRLDAERAWRALV
jgi:hypothetical protein